jgi:hypothetical protein
MTDAALNPDRGNFGIFSFTTLLIWTFLNFILSVAKLENGIQLFAVLASAPFGSLFMMLRFGYAVILHPFLSVPTLILALLMTWISIKLLKLKLFSFKSAIISNLIFFGSILLISQVILSTLFYIKAKEKTDSPSCLRQNSAFHILLAGGISRVPHAALYTPNERYLWSFSEMKFIEMKKSITVLSHVESCKAKLNIR